MNGLTVVTPSEYLVVEAAEAKAFARITHDEEDDLIESWILAATERIEQYLRSSILQKAYLYTLDCFSEEHIELPMPPLLMVDEIQYYDTSGVQTTLSESAYRVTSGYERDAVFPADSESWPITQYNTPGSVKIYYTSGMCLEGVDVPPDIRLACMRLVAMSARYRDVFPSQEDVGAVLGEIEHHASRRF